MAVHRVGRTLLLDELDIQELFMRSSQVQHISAVDDAIIIFAHLINFIYMVIPLFVIVLTL